MRKNYKKKKNNEFVIRSMFSSKNEENNKPQQKIQNQSKIKTINKTMRMKFKVEFLNKPIIFSKIKE